MTEPSSGVPGEIANGNAPTPKPGAPESVELDLDDEKLEAWDQVKSDYQVEPAGEPVPNSTDAPDVGQAED